MTLRPGSRIQRRVEYEALPKLKRPPIELLEMIAIRAIENGRRRLLLATAGRIIDKCDAIASDRRRMRGDQKMIADKRSASARHPSSVSLLCALRFLRGEGADAR